MPGWQGGPTNHEVSHRLTEQKVLLPACPGPWQSLTLETSRAHTLRFNGISVCRETQVLSANATSVLFLMDLSIRRVFFVLQKIRYILKNSRYKKS